ncbi:hypothetical protein BDY24DRAFT_381534 [Mrakia frigida]|uniref:uncharacterized protein n=1 Tax=Mrakia frigida TaxID=29902 RepID=UPI003FCC0423
MPSKRTSKRTSKKASISRPLPYLPPEVKGHILKFCAPATLFSTSLVSLAFLELSSPFLYKDVVIRGSSDLFRLLCVRSDRPQPQIQKHFSLVRMISYHQNTDASYVYKMYQPPRIHALPTPLLPLDKLKVVVENPIAWDRFKSHFEFLLRFFNPASFEFAVTPYQGYGAYRYDVADMSSISLSSVEHWNRLQRLQFTNCFPEWTLARAAFLALETNPKIKLVYDLSLPQTGQTAYG